MDVGSVNGIGGDQNGAASLAAVDDAPLPDRAIHQGYAILLAESGHGWSAGIAAFDIQTMCFADREAALAAGQQIIDGMLRADQAAQLVN